MLAEFKVSIWFGDEDLPHIPFAHVVKFDCASELEKAAGRFLSMICYFSNTIENLERGVTPIDA